MRALVAVRFFTFRATFLAAFALAPAQAQTYPDRLVKIVVPQPPGGGFDSVARNLADKLGPLLGQPVVVENRPGAGTLVGTEAVAKAAPDGYTLLLGALSNIALNPGLYPKLSYDPQKDFVPVGLAVKYSYTLVARKDLPQNSLKELIDYARANPDKLTYASGGNGTGQHVATAVLAHLTNTRMTHVPYKGAQAAYQDVIAGRVDLFFDNTATARAQVNGGTVKALAVSSRDRQTVHPGVPSVIETGIAPLDMETWFGLFVPAGTPAPALARLRAELDRALAMPDLITRFEAGGGRAMRMPVAETDAFVRREIERWTKLLREAGVRGD